MSESTTNDESLDIEIVLLLEAIYLKYGYDFRNYSFTHIKRRILHISALWNITVSELQYQVLYKKSVFYSLLQEFSINVTQMFRDPTFFKALREQILPRFKEYQFIKIWHAGCSTGEEVYSMAILLKELDLYDRCQIYATDINHIVIQKAKEGIYPIEVMRDYTINYQMAGGKTSFSDYFSVQLQSVHIDPSLKEKITFAQHNLATDGVFGEMDIIICRNVFIYFNKDLQNRVVKLFSDSLSNRAYLCLGSKESLQFLHNQPDFHEVVIGERIYQKNC